MTLAIGTRIYYTGEISRLTLEMASAPAVGRIVGTRPTERWGDDYLVELEDGRKLRVPPSSFEAGSRHDPLAAQQAGMTRTHDARRDLRNARAGAWHVLADAPPRDEP